MVEDEATLSDNIKEILSDLGEITQIYDGEEGLFEAETGVYDLILLDLMLPGKNGYEILAELRKKNIQTPVLILTAKDGLEDKITGFQKGADDYLTKPFYREELIMRVKALLKRSLGLFSENQIVYKNITCNLATKEVTIDDEILSIQGKEFDLLVYFIQNKGVILTKEQIFDRIWGFDSDTTITVVEVYMSHLRKHLKPSGADQFFKTLRNVGYILQKD
ncbi:response regulator transcription factor [Enterococcus hirae]|nr:response regulator transcription factor [Enterococcus hirae]